MPYGREGKGLHLSPLPEALNPRLPRRSPQLAIEKGVCPLVREGCSRGVVIPAEMSCAPLHISVVFHLRSAIEAGRRLGVRIVSSPTCSLFTVPRRWA
jgi:hypothetical protein